MCEYAGKSASNFDDFCQANTKIFRLERLRRYFIELIDFLEIIRLISGSPDPYYDECTLQVPFINLVENIKNDLKNAGVDIFELKESAQELIGDPANIFDENTWDFIFNFFYSNFTYCEPQSQDHGWWEIDGKPLTQIFRMITDDHVNAVRLIAEEIVDVIKIKNEESMRALVGPGSLSVNKANFDKEIEIMNEELKNI